jgi:hypothetical protein
MECDSLVSGNYKWVLKYAARCFVDKKSKGKYE